MCKRAYAPINIVGANLWRAQIKLFGPNLKTKSLGYYVNLCVYMYICTSMYIPNLRMQALE